MDYSIILIFSTVILAISYNVWYNYIKRGDKISDEQLMKNYISWQMKKNNVRYFPDFKLNNINEWM